MTFNRQLVLTALTEYDEETPPYSATAVTYTLKNAFVFKWSGIYSRMKTAPNLSQVHRTLRDLAHGGLIIGEKILSADTGHPLPQYEIRWQLVGHEERNQIVADCNKLYSRIKKAKHGNNFFGSKIGWGLLEADLVDLTAQVEYMLSRVKTLKHEPQEVLMLKCLDIINSGIPLPTDPIPASTPVLLIN